MHEIIIHEVSNSDNSKTTYLNSSLKFPMSKEDIERALSGADIDNPCNVFEYTFRMDGLNSTITGPQKVDNLNSLATLLSGMSEYERVKLEGAAVLRNCRTIQDCTKLLYNLDSFELTPDVGDHESYGQYFAKINLTNSLKDIPAEIMEHFDYRKLGKMMLDESENVFIKGHRIRDTGRELREPDLERDPLACCLKIRLCSDENPDGVWIKFPLRDENETSTDSPVHTDEMRVALTSLKADSLDRCRAVECISEYPGIERCFEAHAGELLANLIWKAQNFGCAEGELSQYAKEKGYKKFAAVLEYEKCSNLDFAVDITQNLNCYDFAPDIETYGESYLIEKGVDCTIASCFRLEPIGEFLSIMNDAATNSNGVISRNDNEFTYDYYQPKQEVPVIKDTIRLFCPLEIKTDADSALGEEYSEYEQESDYAVIPNHVAGSYEDEILAAIEKNMSAPDELERGLAIYINSDSSLASKVYSIKPSVEGWNSELWGVVNIETTEDLTPQEMAELKDECLGQLSDGFGESLEQREIDTCDGEIYVSFWNPHGDYFLVPEQEFKEMHPEPQQNHEPIMGGM